MKILPPVLPRTKILPNHRGQAPEQQKNSLPTPRLEPPRSVWPRTKIRRQRRRRAVQLALGLQLVQLPEHRPLGRGRH